MIDFMDLTVTATNAVELADELNASFKHNELGLVNGREPVSRYGQPVARSWANGTVSVTVKGRTKGKVADLYIKAGERLRATTAR